MPRIPAEKRLRFLFFIQIVFCQQRGILERFRPEYRPFLAPTENPLLRRLFLLCRFRRAGTDNRFRAALVFCRSRRREILERGCCQSCKFWPFFAELS
jgi:hypothetical protein